MKKLYIFQNYFSKSGFATSGTLEELCKIFASDSDEPLTTLSELKKAASHDTMRFFIGGHCAAENFIKTNKGLKDLTLLENLI